MRRLFWLLFSLFFPLAAFAADAPPVPDFKPVEGDLSMSYLNAIFGSVGNLLHGTGSQIMGQLFGIFNSGAAVVGGIIVMYTLVVSTLNTANEGQFLGQRWSSVWIPVRTTLGVSLLLPQASGYSTIQVFVMWVVIQGVGLADAVWQKALTFLEHGGVIVSLSYKPSPSTSQDTLDNLGVMFRSQVCLEGLQNQLESIRTQAQSSGAFSPPPPVPSLSSTINLLDNSVVDPKSAIVTVPIPNIKGFFGEGSPEAVAYGKFDGACGVLSYPTAPADAQAGQDYLYRNNQGQLVSLRTVAMQQMQMDMSPSATQAIDWLALPADQRVPSEMGFCPKDASVCKEDNWTNGAPSLLLGTVLKNAYADYQSVMQPAFHEVQHKKWIPEAKEKGWILAGAYYFDLSQMNLSVRTHIDNISSLPIQGPTGVADFCSDKSPFKGLGKNASGAGRCEVLRDWIYANPTANYIASAEKYLTAGEAEVCKTAGPLGTPTQTQQGLPCAPSQNPGSTKAGGIGRQILDAILPQFWNIIGAVHELRNAHHNGENPLLILTALGDTLIQTATSIWLWGTVIVFVSTMVLGIVPSFTISSAPAVVTMWMVPFLTFIMITMFSSGFFLLYYVPAIPFIVFTLASIGWMMGVIESMVAAPLVALGVMHPEGNEVFGKADQGLMFLLNLFLRPAMMIVGLIAGFIVSYVGVWLLGEGFFGVNEVIKHYNTGTAWIWYPACIAMLYAYLAVEVVSKAFGLIHMIPDKVLRWLSGGLQEQLGQMSTQSVQQMGSMTSQSGQQFGQTAGQGTTQFVGRGGIEKGDKEDKGAPKAGIGTDGKES